MLIEFQKAKFYTDIMRFRRYLGEQYANPSNVEFIEDNSGRKRKVAEPIFSIYFLGHKLTNTTAPVIRVKRSCADAVTGEVLDYRDEFIESLTHDSVVIQIPELRETRRNKLESILSIFDQHLRASNDGHIIDVDGYPEEFSFIIRRLLKANSEPELRKKMTIEDEIISELEERERYIAELGEKAEKALIAKTKAEAEKKQAEAENIQLKIEKTQALERAAKVMADKMYISLEEAREILGQ